MISQKQVKNSKLGKNTINKKKIQELTDQQKENLYIL